MSAVREQVHISDVMKLILCAILCTSLVSNFEATFTKEFQ